MKVVAISRNFPKPGGRVTLVKNLKHENLISEIITFKDEKEPFQIQKFYFSSYKQLKKINPDIVLSVGLGNLGAILYGRLNKKKTIYDLSGCRFIGYNFFSLNVIDEVLSMVLANKVIVPSVKNKEVIVSRLGFLKNKIKVIPEGSRKLEKKPHKGFNLGFTLIKDKKIYETIKKNHNKFKGATIHFIPLGKITKIINGKEIDEPGYFADVLPKLDLLFICQTLEGEYHSSTLIEAITNKVPVFNVNLASARHELKDSRLLIPNLKLETFLEYYNSFRKDPKPYLTDLDMQYENFNKRYNYENMLKEWKKELS